jgi:hypothetical protein
MDGIISAADAAEVLQRVLESAGYTMPCETAYPDSYMYIADVNGDGKLSGDDCACIMQKTLDMGGYDFPIISQIVAGTYAYPTK